MGKDSNRKSLKMRRKTGQKNKKARLKRQGETKRAERKKG